MGSEGRNKRGEGGMCELFREGCRLFTKISHSQQLAESSQGVVLHFHKEWEGAPVNGLLVTHLPPGRSVRRTLVH